MKIQFVSIAVAAIIASPCDGFLSFINQAHPALTKYVEAQEHTKVKIDFDIGEEVSIKKGKPVVTGNRLGIDGLLIELHGNEDAKYKHPKLPGANGPNPQLSTGAKSLEVLKQGKFIDLKGSHSVSLEAGVWEIIWRKDAKAGALICGLDAPDEIKRNDASIPKGRVYMTFPVWSQETLSDLRGRKEKAEEKASEALDRLKDANIKMEGETNPLMKALHFRNAMKAHEDIEYSGHNSYQSMPLERDMISMNNGLHMCSLGTVWTKKD